MKTSFFCTAAAAVATCLPGAAQAQVRSFDIPSQAASSGIRLFAQQAGIQVTLAGHEAEGRTTNVVRGELDTLSALDLLLSGTGLVVLSFSESGAIIGADPAQTADAAAITVTGSRIVRRDLESPMPVSVVNMDDAQRFGAVNAYDALTQDPAIGIGQSLASAANGWDAGISSPNLRNLGTNRSLTLIDGQRRVSSSARSSAVDIGMIPVGMIDRIEIVTGGAAAIYGADAVTGAVNIITKRDIEALNISATAGISQEGDASEFMVSISTGGEFADGRGSVSIGGTYSETDPLAFLDRYDDRGWINNVPNPANTGIGDGIPDEIRIEDMRQIYFAYQPSYWLDGKSWIVENGVPREAGYDTLYNPGEFSYGDGGDGRNLLDQNQFRGGLKTLALMGRADFAITDTIDYGGYFSYGRSQYEGAMPHFREDSRSLFFDGEGGAVAYLDNPFLPDPVRQAMIENGVTELNISRTYGNFPIREHTHDRETFTIGQSLSGTLADQFRWQAFWQYGRSEDDVTELTPYKSHWLAARDVIADPVTGEPVCRDEAARTAGCIPHDIFSMDAPSEELVSYVFGERRERRVNTQQIYGANVSGEVLSLPYGEVAVAIGVEHRKEQLATKDDPLALAGELQYGGGPSAHPEIDASFDVSEIYGEVVIPILRDLPFAERLEIEGAYRYSDYSTVGGTDAWKVGAMWAPVDWITFRGVRSRSVRTPNFGELYEPQVTVQQGSISDPCEAGAYHASETRAANCLALGIATPLPDIKVGPLTTTGGNEDLEPETSNSLTLGAIVQPNFLPGFDLTVDYWDINIENVITQFSYTTLLNLCVDLPTIENPYCERIVRDPETGGPATVLSNQLNASRLYARGVDIGAHYRRPLGSGQVNLSLKGTWLLKHVTETTPGIEAGDVQAHNNYRNPRFRATLLTAYEIGKFDLALETRFMSASTYDLDVTSSESHPDNTVPAMVYNDLSLQYNFTNTHSMVLGVKNVFDVMPPNMPVLYTDSQTYDIVGRYFFTTINLKF